MTERISLLNVGQASLFFSPQREGDSRYGSCVLPRQMFAPRVPQEPWSARAPEAEAVPTPPFLNAFSQPATPSSFAPNSWTLPSGEKSQAIASMAMLLSRICYVRSRSHETADYPQHSLTQQLGLEQAIVPFQGPVWEARLHPADQARCQLHIQQLAMMYQREPQSAQHPRPLSNPSLNSDTAHCSAQTLELECRLRDHQNHWRWFRFQETVLNCNGAGQPEQLLGVIEETTHQHQLEQRLYQASFFDPLTGLPNRDLLMHRLEQQLGQTRQADLALVLIDIDDFRVINSRFGHGTGDCLLKSLSQRLKAVLRPSDMLSRWDNDVLAVVLSPLTSATEAEEWIQRLRQQLREPFPLGPRSLFITAGLGMASSLQIEQSSPFSRGVFAPLSQDRAGVAAPPSLHSPRVQSAVQSPVRSAAAASGPNFTPSTPPLAQSSAVRSYPLAEQLVQYAEEALGTAKKQGKNGCSGFNPKQHEHTIQKFAMEALLRRAIAAQLEQFSKAGSGKTAAARALAEPPLSPASSATDPSSSLPRHGELQLYYQPLVDLQTGQLEGFEALIRWQLPGRELLSPLAFIPLAEETGLIIPLGQWVLRQACEQLRQWQQQWPSARQLTMSVNLSPRQLTQPNLVEQVDEVLQATGIAPQQLRLELTENVVMENLPRGRAMLNALRQRQISLSIDDFGTGYSSLSYLDRLPVNTLKIDRSFVQRMGKRGERGEIVRAIVAMAQSLGLETVVEGVCTRQQVSYLRSLGCNKAQGSYFAMPLPAHQAIQWITQAA